MARAIGSKNKNSSQESEVNPKGEGQHDTKKQVEKKKPGPKSKNVNRAKIIAKKATTKKDPATVNNKILTEKNVKTNSNQIKPTNTEPEQLLKPKLALRPLPYSLFKIECPVEI